MLKKIISLSVSLSFLFQSAGFAQVAQLNLAGYLGQNSPAGIERFRPATLRYFSYEPDTNDFQVLLDKADEKGLDESQVREKTNMGRLEEKANDFSLSMQEVFQLEAEEGRESAAEEREALVLAETCRYVKPQES